MNRAFRHIGPFTVQTGAAELLAIVGSQFLKFARIAHEGRTYCDDRADQGGRAAPPAGSGGLSTALRPAGWLRSALFLQASGGRLSWRKVLAGVLFIVAGAAVSLARTSGPGALNTTWIEDAGIFLQDALHQSVLTTLTTQMNGYYDVVPRAVTAVAVLFPLAWAPGIMSAFAAAEYALFGLIVYIASGPHLRNPWLRLLIAAPACVVPLGYTQVNNDLATVQFIALYGLFWLLLWRPATRAGQVCAPVIMLGATLTSILPALLGAPGGGAADRRPVEDRDRRRRVLGGGPGGAVERPVARIEQPVERAVHQPAVDPR